MAKTFKDRRKEKQKANFIGRSEHLDLFRKNLSAPDPINIFNIFGQGGVGKSHLSDQYRDIADNQNCLTAYTDESVKSVLEWMDVVSAQFKERGKELTDFDKRYKDYLQETKKLESDPEKPKGTFGGLMKTLTKGAIKEVKKIPGAEIASSFINEDSIASAVGEWADFVRKKVGNKDEVELVLEPIKVLSPLFWKGTIKHADTHTFICFLIDTFEETDSVLENWLLDSLNDKHGDLPSNLLLVIAGRDELNPNRWSAFESMLQSIPLEPFTDEEANDYLELNGIIDKAVIADILNLSGNLPVLLASLVSAAKSSKTSLTDACKTAVERFLKWVDDKDQRDIALAAALPRQLNKDIIETLLENKTKADELFDWLTKQPFVSRRGNFWVYHGVVRDQVVRFVRTKSPKSWKNDHQKLINYFEHLQIELAIEFELRFKSILWIKQQEEVLYHSLCVDLNKNLPKSMNLLMQILGNNGIEFVKTFPDMIARSEKDTDFGKAIKWNEHVSVGVACLSNSDFNGFSVFVNLLLKNNFISDSKAFSFAFLSKGVACYLKNENDKAIYFYEKAIKHDPKNHEALNNLGGVYYDESSYKKAVKYFKEAIKVNSTYCVAYNNLRIVYYWNKKYNEAIECCKQSLKIDYKQPRIHASIGELYSMVNNHDKAFFHYNEAFSIDPDDENTLNSFGFHLLKIGLIEKSQLHFERVIELGREDIGNINLGHVFLTAQNEKSAMDCYQKSLTAFEDKEAFWAGMKDDFQHLKQYSITLEYYDSVLEKLKKGNI